MLETGERCRSWRNLPNCECILVSRILTQSWFVTDLEPRSQQLRVSSKSEPVCHRTATRTCGNPDAAGRCTADPADCGPLVATISSPCLSQNPTGAEYTS